MIEQMVHDFAQIKVSIRVKISKIRGYISPFQLQSYFLKLLINAKAINEMSGAEKKSLISLPFTEKIQWQRNR